MNWKYKHFQPKEVLSPVGLGKLKYNSVLKIQDFALQTFDDFREFLGMPILCNFADKKLRGYRSVKENMKIYDDLRKRNPKIKTLYDSAHVQGIAFDSHCTKIKTFEYAIVMTAWSIYRFQNSQQGFSGIGIYAHKGFCHKDCRSLLDNYIFVWNAINKKSLTMRYDNPNLLKDPYKFYENIKENLDFPKRWRMPNELTKNDNFMSLFN